MANNWHVNRDSGNPGVCRVDWSNPNSKGCPFDFSEGEHFGTAVEAVDYYSKLREQEEDPFTTVTAEQRDLAEEARQAVEELRGFSPRENLDDPPQYVSPEVGERSFWGRHGKKIGGALVATFALVTITQLANQGNGPIDNADAAGPLGDESVAVEPYAPTYEEGMAGYEEEPLPDPDESFDAQQTGEQVGEQLRSTGERIGEKVTPERVEKAKEVGNGIKDFLGGLIDGVGFDPSNIPNFNGPSVSVPVEVSEGVQFQGKSLQPTDQEIADAQATLDSLRVTPENQDPYYDRSEQFGRSFQTGVVGNLEHRDIPQATFKNDQPQSRAIGGGFIDPYTGEYVEIVQGSSDDTNVDHIVALKEVVKSEDPNNPLSADQKIAIANDFDNLQVVGASVNKSKGDRDPGQWMPPNSSAHQSYAIATINVKSKYNLSVDQAEYDALAQALAGRQ